MCYYVFLSDESILYDAINCIECFNTVLACIQYLNSARFLDDRTLVLVDIASYFTKSVQEHTNSTHTDKRRLIHMDIHTDRHT